MDGVEQLDLKDMKRAYGGAGTGPFNPARLRSILTNGYATGVFSSRKLARATGDSAAFGYVAANEHLDYDTLNVFRRRFLKEIEGLMVQALQIARAMTLASLDHIALDGTKAKANACESKNTGKPPTAPSVGPADQGQINLKPAKSIFLAG